EQGAEPSGQIAADHVAVLRIRCPAGDELRQYSRASAEAALQRVFQIQQTEVILAPLADDDGAGAISALFRPCAAAFTAQLALEVLGISRNPHRAAGLFRPQ